MLQVAGLNDCQQLTVKSNKLCAGFDCVNSSSSKLDASSFLSFSSLSHHTVWVTKDFRSYAIGDNIEYQIHCSLQPALLIQPTEFFVEDNQNNKLNLISVACLSKGTMYMAKLPNIDHNTHLFYVYSSLNYGKPVFVDIEDHYPISIFSGTSHCAAINDEGSILFLSKTMLENNETVPQLFTLPNNEKATCIACCNDFLFATSENGRLYSCPKVENSFTEFVMVVGIPCSRFLQVSGIANHCLALTSEGKVYGYGSDNQNQLGIHHKKLKEFNKFAELEKLNSFEISQVSAGDFRSLFVTKDGQAIACGLANFGELFINSKMKFDFDIIIQKDCKYCFTGCGISYAFINCDPPIHNPNCPITYT